MIKQAREEGERGESVQKGQIGSSSPPSSSSPFLSLERLLL
jgi:hypothetical protein